MNNTCVCFYVQGKANLYNCSSRSVSSLPEGYKVPNKANWLDFSNNELRTFCDSTICRKDISLINFANNILSSICDDTVKALTISDVKTLDLRNNRLQTLPQKIQNLVNLTEMWLSGNPFQCDCNMLWMKTWMDKFNNSGERVVRDYMQVRCKNGYPVHALDPVEMGCFPKELTVGQKIAIGVAAVVTIVVVVAAIAIHRKLEKVKWFIFLHFDYLDKNESSAENVENKDSDALVSYR